MGKRRKKRVTASADAYVRKARIRMINMRPYLAHALLSLPLIPVPDLMEQGGIMCVDARGTIYYDSNKITEFSLEFLAATLEHEIWHFLRDHAGRRVRREACGGSMRSRRWRRTWTGRITLGRRAT